VDPRLYRLSRRLFLSDLGRGTLAVAVLGPTAVACSSGGDGEGAAGPTATGGPPSTTAPDSVETGPVDTAAGGLAPLEWARVNLDFVSAYVLVRGNEAAVVDTGTAGNAPAIESALNTLGSDFSQVNHVVLTHMHPDHVGSLGPVLEATPAASAYAGTDDVAAIESPREVQGLDDGDEVFGLRVIHTPGHTPGHISVFDPDSGLLVAGDALNGTDGSGLSGPNPDFTADLDLANASVAKLAQRDVETVLVGHGEPVESGAGPLLGELAASLG